MKTRIKLFILYILSFVASASPIVIAFFLNWGEYIKAPSDAVKLTVGGLIAVFFILLKVLGKLKMPKGVALYSVVFLFAYLLEALLDDLLLLSGMALLGECIDAIFFRPMIRRIIEKVTIGKTADATAAQIETLLNKYMGVK